MEQRIDYPPEVEDEVSTGARKDELGGVFPLPPFGTTTHAHLADIQVVSTVVVPVVGNAGIRFCTSTWTYYTVLYCIEIRSFLSEVAR